MKALESAVGSSAIPSDERGDALRDLLSAVLGGGDIAAARLFAAESRDTLESRAIGRINLIEQSRQANLERIFLLAFGSAGATETKDAAKSDTAWLMRFLNSAQDAHDELAQGVWARILATELASPGTFALRTLSFLKDMDLWELNAFNEYSAFAFAFESGWRFMLDDEVARREMWSYGRETDITQHWVDIGLLSADVVCLQPARSRGLRIAYRSKLWHVVRDQPNADAQPAGKPGGDDGFHYRKYTVTGQQIASVLEPKTFNGYARNVIKALNDAYGVGLAALEE